MKKIKIECESMEQFLLRLIIRPEQDHEFAGLISERSMVSLGDFLKCETDCSCDLCSIDDRLCVVAVVMDVVVRTVCFVRVKICVFR